MAKESSPTTSDFSDILGQLIEIATCFEVRLK